MTPFWQYCFVRCCSNYLAKLTPLICLILCIFIQESNLFEPGSVEFTFYVCHNSYGPIMIEICISSLIRSILDIQRTRNVTYSIISLSLQYCLSILPCNITIRCSKSKYLPIREWPYICTIV